MNYTQPIKAIKEIIMKTPASRLILIWALVITSLAVWKLPEIVLAIAILGK